MTFQFPCLCYLTSSPPEVFPSTPSQSPTPQAHSRCCPSSDFCISGIPPSDSISLPSSSDSPLTAPMLHHLQSNRPIIFPPQPPFLFLLKEHFLKKHTPLKVICFFFFSELKQKEGCQENILLKVSTAASILFSFVGCQFKKGINQISSKHIGRGKSFSMRRTTINHMFLPER